jgi:hypothetical protein
MTDTPQLLLAHHLNASCLQRRNSHELENWT